MYKMDSNMRLKICKTVKDYAAACIPKDANDAEVLCLMEYLAAVFNSAASDVRNKNKWEF